MRPKLIRTQWRALFPALVTTLCVILIYGWYAQIYSSKFKEGYYPMLGQAFLSGHTYLDVLPSPSVLALPNPYNPRLRHNVSVLWDASLYHGKYYLYFGPVPAVVWGIIKVLTGVSLSDRQLVFVLSTAGTCLLIGLTMLLVRKASFPLLGVPVVLLPVCFGAWLPLMLARPSFYEVAIAGAYCFMALGLLGLLRGSISPRDSDGWKMLGSLSLGFSAGCRLFYALGLVVPLALWLGGACRRSVQSNIREALFLAIPWLACVTDVVLYNYMRFGSVFETGYSYQLTVEDLNHGYLNDWRWANIYSNIYEYFLKPLPLINLLPWHWQSSATELNQSAYGLWCNSPFSLWSLWFLFRIRASRSWLGGAYSWAIGTTLFTLSITLFMLCFHASLNRYMVDFSPWIILLAVLGFMQALQDCRVRWHPALWVAGGFSALLSGYIGLVNAYCGVWLCK